MSAVAPRMVASNLLPPVSVKVRAVRGRVRQATRRRNVETVLLCCFCFVGDFTVGVKGIV